MQNCFHFDSVLTSVWWGYTIKVIFSHFKALAGSKRLNFDIQMMHVWSSNTEIADIVWNYYKTRIGGCL